MGTENTKIWDAVYKPPTSALKQIKGGRLSGMTDIKPQWRYQAATEVFGPCGIGWKFSTIERWVDMGPEGDAMAFVMIHFYFKHGEVWSEPIEGTGGSALIAKESKGLRANDEAYKMATTDALGTAMKMLGFGGAIYAGKYDGSKYIDEKEQPSKKYVESKLPNFETELDKCTTPEEVDAWVEQEKENIKKDLGEMDKQKLRARVSQVKNILEGKR